MGNIYAQRIDAIRSIMNSKGIDAMVITGSDPHNSEYPASRWKQVEWVSGFTGEAGDLVITADHAGLWTDTRYFIQAVQQLAGTGVELHKTRVPEQVLIPEWLANVKFAEKRGTVVVAVDGLSQPVSSVEDIRMLSSEADVPMLKLMTSLTCSRLWTCLISWISCGRTDLPSLHLLSSHWEKIRQGSHAWRRSYGSDICSKRESATRY